MTETCPIWGTKAEIKEFPEKQSTLVNSPRTDGKYFISARAKKMLKQLDDRKKACLTSWLVKQRSLGVQCPRIQEKTISNEEYGQALSMSERANRLLELLESKAKGLADSVRLEYNPRNTTFQKMLAWSESTEQPEIRSLIDHLEKHGWLEKTIDEDCFFPEFIAFFITLTVEGCRHLEELQKMTSNSPKAFVAMWFDEAISKAWEEGIKPAIRDSGYEPFRVDEAEDVGRIDDRIIAEIRRSRFIVTDLTHGAEGARGGVYYEAGFAHGLGKPVIFTCRKDLIEKVHFDIRQYNHILWEKPEDLRTNLANRISAVIGGSPARNIKKQAGE